MGLSRVLSYVLAATLMVFGCAGREESWDNDPIDFARHELDFPAGFLSGSVSWQGSVVSGLGVEHILARVPQGGAAFLDAGGSFALPPLAPGEYTLDIQVDLCGGQPQYSLGSFPVSIAADGATNVQADITLTAGRVIGGITVNGSPLANPVIFIDGLCAEFGNNELGQFSHFLPPGSYTAHVAARGGGPLGSFDFTVLAGQVTDVDIGTTPAGTNVSVDLSGGILSVGGISLTFSSVAQAGTTTVVESGAGPPPPTGFRIVGISGQPRYWDVNTTASYTAPVTVCIHYDATEVQGQEFVLKLVHDDGQGFQDVTTSLDTDADIICGTATSLSPFAVVEPEGTADGDGDGTSDLNDECPNTSAGAAVDGTGCSLDDLVPCTRIEAPWKNRGAYVSAFVSAASRFEALGIIDTATRRALISKAARSDCGNKAKHACAHRLQR